MLSGKYKQISECFSGNNSIAHSSPVKFFMSINERVVKLKKKSYLACLACGPLEASGRYQQAKQTTGPWNG